MKVGMLNDLVRSAFREPVTERYPFEKRPAPALYRGRLHWRPDNCTGCALCVKDCPAEAIELITIDKASKHFVLRYHIDRCTFCGQCVYDCRFDCIDLSDEEWELAGTDPEQFTFTYGRPGDIERLSLEASTEPDVAAIAV